MNARAGVALAMLGVLGTLVSAPAWHAGWVLDDTPAIVDSICVTGALRLDAIFLGNFWCELGMFRTIESWRPWTVLAWWPVWQLSSGAPWAFQMLNTVLHVACTLATFGVARDIGAARTAAWLGAAWFAVLPIHMDAVAGKVGAADLWSTLFVLGSVRYFLRARWSAAWLALGAFLAKETGVLVFPLLGVVEVLRLGVAVPFMAPDAAMRRRRTILVMIAVLMAGAMALRTSVIGAVTSAHIPFGVNPLVAEPWTARMAASLVFLCKYHVLAIVGHPLSADYSYAAVPVGAGISAVYLVCGALVLLGWVGLLVWAILRRDRTLVLLVLWFLGAFGLVSNVPFLLPAMFAERLFYGPSVPLAIVVGIVVAALLDRSTRLASFFRFVFVAIVCVHVVAAMLHAWAFTSERRITAVTAANAPDSARARAWYARVLLREGEIRSAEPHVVAALAIMPDWGVPWALAGALHDLEGRPERALEHFRAAMQRDPQDAEVTDLFIQFLVRYGHVEQAREVYASHAHARGVPHESVTMP